jgi:nucleoside-diphosphate-sugar epimerase
MLYVCRKIKMMQTILGAGGAIGIELARALPKYTTNIRLVSRNPKKVNDSDQLLSADLSNRDQVHNAVKGSQITYLTLGFDYNTKLWQEKWPVLIKNVVDACIEHQSKLVFFDNVYAIGGDNIKRITENSPISPSSKKGEVRAFVDQHILDAISNRKLEAIIARAPDFFGPVKDKSLLMNLIYDNLVKGKPAQWFCNADLVHSSGFTPDLAKGTAILGNTESAYNNIWNLPVDNEHLTGRQWIKLFADEMQKPDKVQVLPGWGMRALGLFVPILKEMYEMRYQYDRAYYFDSSKFNRAFNYIPTSNKEAVRMTVKSLK